MGEEKTEEPTEATPGEVGVAKTKMGQPSASEESASQYPDMDLCQDIHKLSVKASVGDNELEQLQTKSFERVAKELENPSLYRHMQQSLQVTGSMSESDLSSLESKHAKTLEELEAKVEEAKENAGDMEVMDARIEISRFAAKSLSKDQALDAYKKLLDLPKISSGKKIDALMESSRVASFYGDTGKSDEYIDSVCW